MTEFFKVLILIWAVFGLMMAFIVINAADDDKPPPPKRLGIRGMAYMKMDTSIGWRLLARVLGEKRCEKAFKDRTRGCVYVDGGGRIYPLRGGPMSEQ